MREKKVCIARAKCDSDISSSVSNKMCKIYNETKAYRYMYKYIWPTFLLSLPGFQSCFFYIFTLFFVNNQDKVDDMMGVSMYGIVIQSTGEKETDTI